MSIERALHPKAAVAGVLAIACATMALGIGSAEACGCGALVGASEVSEKALVTLHAGRETIIPGLTITHAGEHAAVVFPVPARPRIRALAAGMNLFGQLENATIPAPKANPPSSGPPSAGGAPMVVSRKVIGGYAVSVLRGGNRETVLGWLSTHHYVLPTGAGPILGGYIAAGWYFVAIRLSKRSSGEIKPLAISFASARIVYPMKLSRVATAPVDLELFLNSDGPVRARGATALRTRFRGTTASIAGELSRKARVLLPGSYLERVVISHGTPSAIHTDIEATSVRR